MAKSTETTQLDPSRLFGFAQVERVSSDASNADELLSKEGFQESSQDDSKLQQTLELHSKVGEGEN